MQGSTLQYTCQTHKELHIRDFMKVKSRRCQLSLHYTPRLTMIEIHVKAYSTDSSSHNLCEECHKQSEHDESQVCGSKETAQLPPHQVVFNRQVVSRIPLSPLN